MKQKVLFFDTVHDVLTANIETMAKVKGVEPDEVCQLVYDHLRKNSAEWNSRKQPNINYKDPLCRMAYLYGITAANAALVKKVLEIDKDLLPYLRHCQEQNGQIEVCALGGGPGTEVLGFAKFLQDSGEELNVNFLILDKVQEWSESWMALRKQINNRLRGAHGNNQRDWPFHVTGNFTAIDIKDTESYSNLNSLFDQDLFIFCYFLSEIFDDTEALATFMSNVVSNARPGAKFLFIDRGRSGKWHGEVRKLASDIGLSLGTIHPTTGRIDEAPSLLGNIYKQVGREPRLTWNSFWCLATKE